MTNKISQLLIALVLFSITLISCENEENTIGSNLLPKTDFLEYLTDSSEVITTKVLKFDSEYSVIGNSKNIFLGSYYDKTFGKIKANVASAVTGSIDPLFVKYIDDDINSDFSLKLVLRPIGDSLARGFSGDTAKISDVTQKFTIYSVKKDIIKSDTVTTANFNLDDYVGEELSISTVRFNLTDNLYEFDLDKLADKIREKKSELSQESNSSLDIITKGLIIKSEYVDSEGGGLVYFTLDTTSYIKFDYKYKKDVKVGDNVVTDSIISSVSKFKFVTSQTINTIERDYTGTKLEETFNWVDVETDGNIKQENIIYTQSLSGSRTQIEFPELNHLLDSNIVIQEAILSVGIDEEYYESGKIAIPNLWLYPIKDNKIYTLNSFTNKMSYNTSKKMFYSNVTDVIINILEGNISNHGFHLLQESSSSMSNIALKGVGDDYKSLKIKISYSKYNKE